MEIVAGEGKKREIFGPSHPSEPPLFPGFGPPTLLAPPFQPPLLEKKTEKKTTTKKRKKAPMTKNFFFRRKKKHNGDGKKEGKTKILIFLVNGAKIEQKWVWERGEGGEKWFRPLWEAPRTVESTWPHACFVGDSLLNLLEQERPLEPQHLQVVLSASTHILTSSGPESSPLSSSLSPS